MSVRTVPIIEKREPDIDYIIRTSCWPPGMLTATWQLLPGQTRDFALAGDLELDGTVRPIFLSPDLLLQRTANFWIRAFIVSATYRLSWLSSASLPRVREVLDAVVRGTDPDPVVPVHTQRDRPAHARFEVLVERGRTEPAGLGRCPSGLAASLPARTSGYD